VFYVGRISASLMRSVRRHMRLMAALAMILMSCDAHGPANVMGTDQNTYAPRFASYSESFDAFARSHNLLIEKYHHDTPMWSFCFSHPEGGQAKLDLFIDESGAITLYPVWWIDSYSDFTRSIKWGDKISAPREVDAVVATLRDALAMVVAWRTGGQWTQIAGGYAPTWGRYSEDEFRAMAPQWPSPEL